MNSSSHKEWFTNVLTNNSEWMTSNVWMISYWSHIGFHQSASCLLFRGRNHEDKSLLPSANCYNWGIKTQWRQMRMDFFTESTFIHTTVTHRCNGLGLFAAHLCAAAERQDDGGESKSTFFAPSVKPKQIGWLDEWTWLCPFPTQHSFVRPPLLRKPCWGHNWCHSHACVHRHCNDDEPCN